MAKYLVTIFNQHTGTPVSAERNSRREAFRRALMKAGEEWLRTGGDKLTTLRTLFAENLMSGYYRIAPYAYASCPTGAGVKFRKLGAYVPRSLIRGPKSPAS